MLPKRICTLALSIAFLFVGQAVVDSAPDLEIQTIKSGANVVVDQVVEEGSKVIVTVLDAQKNPIVGLTAEDFTISQAGRTANIVSVEPMETNLDVSRHIALVLDNSYSMSERDAVGPLKAAVNELLKIVRPIDQVSMVVFQDRKTMTMAGRNLHVRVLQSNIPDDLRGFLNDAYSTDSMTTKTVLFEGVLAGLDLIRQMPKDEPKFMVVFSDGEDLNSAFKVEDVAAAAQGLPSFGAYTIDYMPGPGLDAFLSSFATEHQGKTWKANEQTNLVPIFQEVASRLQHHYVVSYLFPLTGNLALEPASLTIEEIKTLDASPMLGHVYFDDGSAEIPERYVRFAESEQTQTFDAQQLRGTLDKYYQILNLLGHRLTENPDAWLTIVGCNANSGKEKGNKKLSNQRAQTVQAYLQAIWNIALERMPIEARNLPEKPSTTRIEEGLADNRRVEIRSEDPEVLDLVRSTYVSTQIDHRALTLWPSVDSVYGMANWRVVSRGGGQTLADLSGVGRPAEEVIVPLGITDLAALATAGSITIDMEMEDNQGQKLTLSAAPQVNFIETKELLAQKQGYRVQEKYALILFDFDSDDIGARNQVIVDEIVARIRELTDAHVAIVGHTDNIGKEDYNLKLSERRAKAVYDQLMASYGSDAADRISYTGVGASDPLYDNLSPEARAFNRTVTITLEYVAKE